MFTGVTNKNQTPTKPIIAKQIKKKKKTGTDVSENVLILHEVNHLITNRNLQFLKNVFTVWNTKFIFQYIF